MDGQRFDTLARAWGDRVSRRRLIGGLFGLAVGAGALAVADDATAAGRTCRLAGAKCVQPRQCCSGLCETATRRGRIRRCVCPAGKTECRGQCVDLGTTNNCLACGNACGAGQGCCEDGCTDLGTQNACRTCGDVCNGANDELCIAGQGCKNACFASQVPIDAPKGSGFYTTDSPPVFIPGTTASATIYGDPVDLLTVVSCTTSADCSDCASAIAAAEGRSGQFPDVQGCGCLQYECGEHGGGDMTGTVAFYGASGFACAITYIVS